MEVFRTANAGVLLRLDNVTVLLDGVCQVGKNYLATPDVVLEALMQDVPDIVAVTHGHLDHFDPSYASFYSEVARRPVLGPASLPVYPLAAEPVTVKGVTVTPVPSRHIGAAGKTVEHVSFVVQGSRCVWFMGDSAPSQWRNAELPKPDVIIAPYAYASTESSWALTQSFGAGDVIIVHLPDRQDDPYLLWEAVLTTTQKNNAAHVHFPEIAEMISIP